MSWSYLIPGYGVYKMAKDAWGAMNPEAPDQTMPDNPYQADQNALIAQLKQQMAGPSQAAMEYRQNAGNALGQQLMLGRGRGPGAARQAGYVGGQMQQGMALQGQMAQTAERSAQLQNLAQVLQGAGQLEFLRRKAELDARLNAAALPTGFDRLMGLGTAVGGIAMGKGGK